MTDHGSERDPHDPLGRPHSDASRKIRGYAAAAIAILALVLILQNSQSVEFNFFFAHVELPLVFGLVIAIAIGALLGWLVPRVRGHGNRG